MTAPRKQEGRRGFTLVELMIVVSIVGILAALAVPAFLRYVKSSKVAEAEGVLRKLADGAKGYFTTEQRYSDAVRGDQPWHAAATPSEAGLPVPNTAYVFPGGSNCTVRTSTVIPSGGKKLPVGLDATACSTDPSASPAKATLDKLRVSFDGALYFRYSYASSGTGTDAASSLTAEADFDTSSSEHHTASMNIRATSDGNVAITPMALVHQFE